MPKPFTVCSCVLWAGGHGLSETRPMDVGHIYPQDRESIQQTTNIIVLKVPSFSVAFFCYIFCVKNKDILSEFHPIIILLHKTCEK